jgi:hypothetical protein
MPLRIIRTVLLVLVAATLAFGVGWALGDLVVSGPPTRLLGEPGKALHRASS